MELEKTSSACRARFSSTDVTLSSWLKKKCVVRTNWMNGEQIELFWSQAPSILSELSVDEHAELLAKAAPVAWRRAAPRVQAAPQAGWMDEEGLAGGPRSCCGKKSTPKGQAVSPPSMAQDVFRAVEACGEAGQ